MTDRRDRLFDVRARRIAAGLSACALLSAAAVLAGPGPDLTVSDVSGTVSEPGSYGTDGSGVYAYDFQTVSCNIGTAGAAWQASNNQHPVIALNLHRLKNGQFEQIGMAWAKHASFAASEPGCGYLCDGQYGQVLGVGCSDAYSTATNGYQAFLGPRSQINASTGYFPYDTATVNAWPPYSGILARRIQVAQADVDPTQNVGASYFAEAVYIAADDAAAGNSWNNVTYRAATFASDSLYTLSFPSASAAQTASAAIMGWSAIDPSVRVTAVDVPGDGRFFVAEKVSNNGDGTWHYEFAIENLCSDRSAASFTVPMASGTVVTNAQFHGIAYHSGETFSSLPWTASVGAASITFAAQQTYAQNPSANALRWGTLYNVRFDANEGPGTALATATLGLFKPGSGLNALLSGVNVGVISPAGATLAVSPPLNDACAGALPLHAGQNAFTTFGATAVGPAACTEQGNANLLSDVWFTYTFNDTCSGTITFSTCSSDFDTKLAVYSGTSCVSMGALLGCNDDAGVLCAGSTTWSSVSVAGSPGATYLVRVGSRSGAVGDGLLTVTVPRCVPPPGACCVTAGTCFLTEGPDSCTRQAGSLYEGANTVCNPNPCPQPPRPPNDDCVNAVPLADASAGGSAVRGTTVWALPAIPNGDISLCGGGVRANSDVWYTYTPAVSSAVTVDLCSSVGATDMSDMAVQVQSGSCSGPAIACAASGCGPTDSWGTVTVSMTAGTTYYIRVFPTGSSTGTFAVKVTGGAGTLAGACCAGATCSQRLPAACTGANSKFVATGAPCNASGNSATPCCKADFNHSGTVTIQDIFDFLTAWFARSPSADITGNGAGAPSVQSMFDYLAAWFAKAC